MAETLRLRRLDQRAFEKGGGALFALVKISL